MEKVIGALGKAFEQEYDGVTFTYNPTGSGTGIQAVFHLFLQPTPIIIATKCKMIKEPFVKSMSNHSLNNKLKTSLLCKIK